MSHEKLTKKQKKALQIAKNLQHLHINQQAAVHERNRELDREREEELREAAMESGRIAERTSAGQPVWSAKLQMIRDKNTGRARMASERWNRFAGTEGGGGRGL